MLSKFFFKHCVGKMSERATNVVVTEPSTENKQKKFLNISMPALPHALSFLLGAAATALLVLYLQRRSRKNRHGVPEVPPSDGIQHEQQYMVQPHVHDIPQVVESPAWESAPDVAKGMWVIGENGDEEVDVSDEELEVRPMTGPRLPNSEEQDEEEDEPVVQPEVLSRLHEVVSPPPSPVEKEHEESTFREPVREEGRARKVRTRARTFVPLDEDTVNI